VAPALLTLNSALDTSPTFLNKRPALLTTSIASGNNNNSTITCLSWILSTDLKGLNIHSFRTFLPGLLLVWSNKLNNENPSFALPFPLITFGCFSSWKICRDVKAFVSNLTNPPRSNLLSLPTGTLPPISSEYTLFCK